MWLSLQIRSDAGADKTDCGKLEMNRTAMETEQFLGRFDAEMGKAELLICMPFTDLYLAENTWQVRA